MGQYDSSRTRVAPVFDVLMDKDPTGCSWLPVLLKLGSRSAGRVEALVPGPLMPRHPRWWGDNERRLDPPMELLRWLIDNLHAPVPESAWGSGDTKRKRQLLVNGDSETRAEALRLLDGPRKPRAWHILEGPSFPDACLETSSLILVIEGKRTEAACTTSTTWMPQRSQMLRHMDAACELPENKRVLGLMIVEGSSDKVMEPTSYWLNQADEQVNIQMLDTSLPHRAPESEFMH